jgi:hypothetical protein
VDQVASVPTGAGNWWARQTPGNANRLGETTQEAAQEAPPETGTDMENTTKRSRIPH